MIGDIVLALCAFVAGVFVGPEKAMAAFVAVRDWFAGLFK
jgi:hypothetical protein